MDGFLFPRREKSLKEKKEEKLLKKIVDSTDTTLTQKETADLGLTSDNPKAVLERIMSEDDSGAQSVPLGQDPLSHTYRPL